MIEKKHFETSPTRGQCIDMRGDRAYIPDQTEIKLEDDTYDALSDHVSEGMYQLGIKFFGMAPPNHKFGRTKNTGPNCINHNYKNVFITGSDNYFHIWIIK